MERNVGAAGRKTGMTQYLDTSYHTLRLFGTQGQGQLDSKAFKSTEVLQFVHYISFMEKVSPPV